MPLEVPPALNSCIAFLMLFLPNENQSPEVNINLQFNFIML